MNMGRRPRSPASGRPRAAWVWGLALAACVRPLLGNATAPRDSSEALADSIARYGILDPVEVNASEQTLREIIQRSVEGEKTKLAGHRDMTYNATVRSILTWEGKRREILDEVYLVYEDDRGFGRRVRLAETKQVFDFREGSWVPRRDGNRPGAEVRVEAASDTRGAELSQLPFFLEDQEEFDFTLRERHLEGDHVLFKIAFRPRSRFKPLPSGTVYVDTHDYRIVHEEFTFEENPAPLFLKGVRGVSRHWMELPGGQWVVSRILGELELRGGWTGWIPGRVEFSVLQNDYRFDRGYDEHRFGPR